MARFAQIDNDVVTGILVATTAPTVLPEGRTFVDITDQPDVVELCRVVDGKFEPPTPPAPQASIDDVLLERVSAIAQKLGV